MSREKRVTIRLLPDEARLIANLAETKCFPGLVADHVAEEGKRVVAHVRACLDAQADPAPQDEQPTTDSPNPEKLVGRLKRIEAFATKHASLYNDKAQRMTTEAEREYCFGLRDAYEEMGAHARSALHDYEEGK